MKATLFLLLILTTFSASAQSDTSGRAINLLKQKIANRAANSSDLNEWKQYGYKVQNQGFMLEEHQHDYKGSLKLIDSAIEIWTVSKDTINTANLLKYRGYLLGKLGRFTEAKTDIDLAIRFFSQQKYEMGVMVSEFDLSRVYESEQKPDSALKYAMLTLSYWQRRKDTSRVLASANQTINLYIKIKRYDAASAMQRQTIPLLEKQDMHPQQIMDFYFLSIQLFKKTNDTVQEKRYQEIFDQKEKQLKTEDRMPVPGFSVYP